MCLTFVSSGLATLKFPQGHGKHSAASLLGAPS